MLQKLVTSVKNNHFAQMAICCILPVIFILGLQVTGINASWIYTIAIVGCIALHIGMMYFANKEGNKCH